MATKTLAALAACAAGAAAQSVPVPDTWPLQHTHQEVMFTPSAGTVHNKQVAYDFTNLALRYDIVYESGPQVPLVTLLNFTSLWLNDTLYMYTWEVPLDPLPSCVALEMGFGIMFPDWFKVGANFTSGHIWATHKAVDDPTYHKTMLYQKGDGVSDEPFSYYAWLDGSAVPGQTDGAPFRMSAPSPTGNVVNEYFNFQPATFAPGDPVFALPSSPACIPAPGVATSAQHAVELLRATPGAKHLAAAPVLAEIFVAALSHRDRAHL